MISSRRQIAVTLIALAGAAAALGARPSPHGIRGVDGLARPLTGSLQLDDVPSAAPPINEGTSTPIPATSTGVPPAASTTLPPAGH